MEITKSFKNNLAIFGCGGHARSVADVMLDAGNKIELFFDSNALAGEHIFNIPCKSVEQEILSVEYWHIGVGHSAQRKAAVELLTKMERQLISVISNRSYVGQEASLGLGVFLGQGCHVGPLTSIGDFTIINTGAVVEHEAKIGQYCHVSVNAVVAGRAEIGDNVFVGAGAIVRDGITICDNVTLGAGAVAISNITEPGTYAGIPCQRLGKAHNEVDIQSE